MREIDGATELFACIRARGGKVYLTTGFSAHTQRAIITALGWDSSIDGALAPSDTVRGRPYPDLIWAAAHDAQVASIAQVTAAGDTRGDMQAAVASGTTRRYGVRTGAHADTDLLAGGASEVIDSIADLTLSNDSDNPIITTKSAVAKQV